MYTTKKYFVCRCGIGPLDEQYAGGGVVGRVYVWDGEWDRSPEAVADRERNPTMKLRPLWPHPNELTSIIGDVADFTEIVFPGEAHEDR